MPTPASSSPGPTPRSSPSTPPAGSSRSRPTSGRRSPRCSSRATLGALALALLTSRAGAQVEQRARLLRIEDTRRDEPAFVDSLLASRDPSLRATAALTAGRVGALAHLAGLRHLALDVDARVAGNALFALALARDSGALTVAEQALRRRDAAAPQGATLLAALGERARPALLSALGDSGVRPPARAALLLAAARLRPVPGGVFPWTASPDTALAWRAAYAIARGRSPAGARTLLAAASSPSGAVREQAARGLGRALAGDSLADTAVATLARLAADTSARVRVNATRSLASYGARSRASVEHALRDADAGVRLTAAQSLDLVLDTTLATWRHAMDADTSFVVQRAVAEGAVHHGVPSIVPGEWRTSAEWQRRAAAAELDAAGPAPAALARTDRGLHDVDGRVRAAAAGAVARLADSAATRDPARRLLRASLLDRDVQVRTAALGGLAAAAGAADLAAALPSYELSRADHDADARLAFWVLADSALRHVPALPDSVVTRLAALERPADPLERIAAARIPRFAAWRDSTAVARPMAWYRARAREALSPRQPRARIVTDRGTMDLALFGSDAPLTVYNFVSLARSRYFDGQRFHRVVPNFVVQGGDPRGDGNGGPGWAIRDEINPRPYLRGTLGMALSGPNTGGSQFFVTHSPQPHLDGGYTVFGQLLAGGDVLDRIVQGDRIVRITIR